MFKARRRKQQEERPKRRAWFRRRPKPGETSKRRAWFRRRRRKARENSRGGAAAKVAATAVIPIATSTIDHINASTNEHYGAGR
jgi:hypothetical protein